MAKNIYDRLKNDAWAVMSESEKKDFLAEVEQQEAKEQKRGPRSLEFADMGPGALGCYSEKDNKLRLSNSLLDSAGDAICIVIHEGRHAYQNDVVNSKISDKNFISWSKNWYGYLDPRNPNVEPMDYYLQPIEQDAWGYSVKKLNAIAKRTKDSSISLAAVDYTMTFNKQFLKAQLLYGKNFMQTIQAKVDSVYNNRKNFPSSYPAVMQKLTKQGFPGNKALVDYIVFSGPKDKPTEDKLAQTENKPTINLSKLQKDLATKHGFSEEAAKKVIESLKDSKTQKEKVAAAEVPKTKKVADSLTVKISVKDEKVKEK